MGRTLYGKIWDAHVVATEPTGGTLLYVDLHLIHEVTTPQAFAGLRAHGRRVRRPDRTLAVNDHNIPTEGQAHGVQAVVNLESRLQLETLMRNVADAGIEFFPLGDLRNGVVHVAGPEQGRSLPGTVIVCGDSHTSTHGAFGALAFGIGTSEVEHVLATQTIWQNLSRAMRVWFDGELPLGCSAKDMALAFIGLIGTGGATGHVVEFCGPAVRKLSMEGRMTLCNMTIEAGARAGLVAPDETTIAYLQGRPAVPAGKQFGVIARRWRELYSDEDAVFDQEVRIDVSQLAPTVTWGTSPQDAIRIDGIVPGPDHRDGAARALDYMALVPGQPIAGTPIDHVFIGSCTNGRLEDLRSAAHVVRGRKVAPSVRAMVVPGSGLVRQAAEAEGLDRIFLYAGFEWREPGCSMCLAMNEDRLPPGARCASTSNRNFEGRQGREGRTHLMSPAMAAAAAVTGAITDVRELIA